MDNDFDQHKGCGEHNKHSGQECCGKKQPMQRFMETSLLVLLAQQPGHGYSLSEQLNDFGFRDINASTLYRIMRKMDEGGWVSSSWEKGDKGPQRRVYAITDIGRAALDEWIEVFKQRKSNIETLLSKYTEQKKGGGV